MSTSRGKEENNFFSQKTPLYESKVGSMTTPKSILSHSKTHGNGFYKTLKKVTFNEDSLVNEI